MIGLTRSIKHLVTFVEHEYFDASESKRLVAYESFESSRSADNDVRAGVLALEDFGVFHDGSASIEDTCLDVRHVFAEPVVLVANLVSQLTSVAHNDDGNFSIDGLDLLEGSENEDSCLSQARLGLADNISTKKSLGNTGLLDCRSNGC